MTHAPTDLDHDHDHGHHHGHDHDHAHGHHHDHDDPLHPQIGVEINPDELDPANRSLAEALRVSFAILKVVMIALVVMFLFSGVFQVKQGQVAVRIHLGAVAGEPGKQVYGPDTYLAWPAPIDRIVYIPTTQQSVDIDKAFWFHVRPEDQAKKLDELPVSNSLIPGQDGSLITGDKNIVHAKWTVYYSILKPDAVSFVKNVGLTGDRQLEALSPDNPDRDAYLRMSAERRSLYHADQLVRNVAEEAIVAAVARMKADDFVRAQIDSDAIKEAVQHRLSQLDSGITVSKVLPLSPIAPLSVRSAFQEVSSAQSEKAAKIASAQKQANDILVRTAGTAYTDVEKAIEDYEAARKLGGPGVQKSYEKLTALLDSDRIQGDAGAMLKDARSYRASAAEQVRAEADRFLKLLPGYHRSPRIVLDRLWQDTRQAVLAGDVETFYLPDDKATSLWLEINRDPAIEKKRAKKQYEDQQRQANAAAGSTADQGTP